MHYRLLILLTLGFLASIVARANDYTVNWSVTASTSAVTTVQQIVTASPRVVHGRRVVGFCSVACTILIERDGTAASSTSATIVKNGDGARDAQFTAWTASNVGSGTVHQRHRRTAGGFFDIDISDMVMRGAVTTKNLTVRITLDSSGDSQGSLKVSERLN